jgi:hypothetical protein
MRPELDIEFLLADYGLLSRGCCQASCSYGCLERALCSGGRVCLGYLYRLSVCIRLCIRTSVGSALEHGPSRSHAKSLTSGSPEHGIFRGHIVTQIVWHAAHPLDPIDTRIGSCFVSPSQYGLALYQRSTTLGSTVATKTLGASFMKWTVPAPLSSWLISSIRSNVKAGSERVKRKFRGSLVLSCADTIIDSRPTRTGSIPCSALVGLPLACEAAFINAIAPTTTAIVPIVPTSSASTMAGSILI